MMDVTKSEWTTNLAAALLMLAASACWGCGGDADRQAALDVEVIGWGPDEDGSVAFQSGLPEFEGASQVRVQLTHPSTSRVLGEETVDADEGGVEMPELDFGDYLRLEFHVLDDSGTVLAAGATPQFDMDEEAESRDFRIQVDPVEDFAPVGSRVTEDGESVLAQSRLDHRSYEGDRWIGRAGHVTVPYERDNKALVVGGGYRLSTSMGEPGATPGFEAVHADVMTFDPTTGYFTDLGYDESAEARRDDGADRLEDARAHHTVTPIGDDRFLVIGGLTLDSSDEARPLASIELIDMGAEAGDRVRPFTAGRDSAVELSEARALHTATYRPEDDAVVVAGGVGEDDEPLDSTEIIDVESGAVNSGPSLAQARAEHEAALMGDDETIWFVGGRDDSEALATTEVLTSEDGEETVEQEAQLNTGRFGFSLVPMGPSDDSMLIAVGGFTDLDGGVTDTYEIGARDRRSFFSDSSSRLETARARPAAFELPRSDDVLVLGGWDDEHQQAETAELLEYVDFGGSDAVDDNDAYEAGTLEAGPYNERADFSATPLANEKVLLVGGIGEFDGDQAFLDSAEYFTPVPSMD